ncbi:DUF4153 domain-containing protein [Microbispora sp. H10836]|uniref:DUF4153 domain-containing protein n=1 Tax=Microbispora sp. H10836 TaxID=2729106 RepID=UPI001B8BA6F1|nr:DUF4153 domain-containing protein [Microbispora sp. H10836]
MRPLDFLGRIKVKLGIVIVLAVVAAFVVNEVGINSGLSRDLRIAIAVVLALIMVQLLARGMIRPLREMAAAAQTIAKGRYGLRVTATSRDEVGELARAFNAMAADLAEVDRQRRELVANVSHELRTPITGLQAVLENVVDGVTPPDLDTLGTALAQTQRLGRLVAQLLDLSRLDSGARLIEPEELDLASLCRQAVSEAALARDDVTVVSAVPPGTALSADAALLAQVLANLLDNAVRHSPSGGTVRVEARAAGPNLEIGVTDEGPGIPPAERARVFERFSRLDAGRAADAGGAGLGLAIAKEIVELHGGSISVADPLPVARRPAGRGRGTAPGCRMVVALPRQGEPAAGESVDGPVHVGERRGNMEIEAGGGHTAGRHDGDVVGSPAAAGIGPARAGATAAGGSSGSEDADGHPHEATRGGRARAEEDERPEAGHTESPEPLRAAGVSSPPGRAEAGHLGAGEHRPSGDGTGDGDALGTRGEDAWPSSPVTADGDGRSGERQVESFEPSREAPAPPRRTGTAETGHDRAGDLGISPDGIAGSDGGEDREDPRRQGLVRTRADQPYPVPSAGGAGVPGQVFAPRAGVPYDPAGQVARAALGAGVGMFAGFLAGLIAPVFLGVGSLGIVSLALFTAVGAIVGAARGSSTARRAAATAASAPPPPWYTTRPTPATGTVSGSAVPASGSPEGASVPVAVTMSTEPGSRPGPPGSSVPTVAAAVHSVSVSPPPVPATPGGTPPENPAGPRVQGHAQPRQVSPEASVPSMPFTPSMPPVPPVPGAHAPGRYPPPPAYVPPPLFPRPDLPEAPRWLLPAAAAAGLVAAVTLPYTSAGLGLVLTAVALGAAAFPAVLPLRRGRVTPWTLAFGLLAYALVSVALFRDAEWLVGPVLLAAFGVGSLALSGGGRGWLAVIRGGISVALAALPTPWFLAGPIRTLARRRRMLPTLVSAAVTVVLLAVFGLLFSSADAVFSAFLSDLLRTPEWAQSLPYRVFVFCVFAVLAAAAVLVGLRPVAEPAAPDLRMSLGRQVWVIPLAGLNLLFAAFVTVQITVLFGGSRRVLSTAGLTYAEYARSGFFELVTVSLFVLGVVAAAVALLRLRGRADRWVLAVLLGLLCAFTLVILASALHRIGLYTDAYGLSRLRASVVATIWWLGAVFVLVLAAGAVRLFGGGTSWFFRGLVLLTGVSLLAFAVWDPDARVAETQLTIRGVERLDHGYLGDLGAEAVPILDRLPEPDRSCVLSDVVAVNGLREPDPWNGWNLARARAREVLERRPVVRPDDCPASSRVPGPYD